MSRKEGWQGRVYEDFELGDVYQHPVGRTITEADNICFTLYFNCMPCHGDRGQGLTDAWRQTWVEDHRNCWGRGCHAGHSSEEGFPIPTIIPAVILDQDALKNYASPQALFEYLKKTHPIQEPGRLEDDEYQTLVAFLLFRQNEEGIVRKSDMPSY